ncbi:response regulator transcription factor [Conexibacter sp. JD483]|uniref:response regulator transcription factor n=1 Tax=unclassified Conexibacter TaxID=2627773 RepID=UPI00271AFA0F|nr:MULTISPECIES: response regulator transcription factor [unclassified Conexibacter]MDO8187387.1 response regulator transcription factor [Conexibacter sp. CPCC 205706]MDO8200982.1 response regulator transcription factor [Conexibacter sp. CPCC 205762]MDR9371396.1 response regulator transcription factor [Conexibacter sp. JD483]
MSAPRPHVLFVEDDSTIRETTALLLETLGFDVTVSADGQAGLNAFRAGRFDVALVDVMLPRIDGISLVRLIRENSQVAVVLLSARSEPLDVVAGLEAGADDYVAKPFDGPVLAARLRAVLRRTERAAQEDGDGRVLVVRDLALDPEGMTARVAGEPVSLTTTEARLLTELARNVGIVLSRAVLLERVWEYDWDGDTRLVDVHIQRLRAKIGRDRIETVRGAGYKLLP